MDNLPNDLVGVIMKKVGANDFRDLLRTRQCSRLLNEIGHSRHVLRHTDFYRQHLVWGYFPNVPGPRLDFYNSLIAADNYECLLSDGLMAFFRYRDVETSILQLDRAIQSGEEVESAVYAKAVVLLLSGDKESQLNNIQSLWTMCRNSLARHRAKLHEQVSSWWMHPSLGRHLAMKFCAEHRHHTVNFGDWGDDEPTRGCAFCYTDFELERILEKF